MSLESQIREGRAAYVKFNCAICHGDEGRGNGMVGQFMTPKPRNFVDELMKKGDSQLDLFKTISVGLCAMPGYQTTISAEERMLLAAYVRSLKKGSTP